MDDHEVLIEHGHRIKRTEDDVKNLQHTIYGNGTPGLKTDVDRLKQRGLRMDQAWGLWIAAIGAIISALGVLASFLK